MENLVISYSYSGNNEALADGVAKGIASEHVKVIEKKTRKMGTIIFDMIFNRTPKIEPINKKLDDYDMVYLFAPVWMGSVAAPLRPVLGEIQKYKCNYTFVSISGGADGDNMKLKDDLVVRTGREPSDIIDLHIADLLPAEPKPERKDTMHYKLSGDEITRLSEDVINRLS